MVEINQHKYPKIVHLQYGSSPSGNYTIRQHQAFLKAGFDSKVLSMHSDVTGDPRVQNLGKGAKLRGRINQKLQGIVTKNRNKEYGGFSCSFIGSDVSTHPLVTEADVVYVHWVLGGFMSIKNLEQLASLGKPMIMVMHDMWALTGGCSHSFDCPKFNTHCHNCPILAGDKERDLSFKQFERKMKLYENNDNIYFVSPSVWLYNLAKNAPLTKNKPIFHIPNVIDTSIFKPFDKKVAKKILNINEDALAISFGANKITSPYKGWKYLEEALQKLAQKRLSKDIQVLVFGSGDNEEIRRLIPFNTIFMGYIKDDYATNLIYNASDVFVVPSMADNLPTTILESMSCGTAVVGFKVGGIPDMITHKENGYLARYKDADDLAEGIEYCIDNNIKGTLAPRFSMNRFIQDHLDLLSTIKPLSGNR